MEQKKQTLEKKIEFYKSSSNFFGVYFQKPSLKKDDSLANHAIKSLKKVEKTDTLEINEKPIKSQNSGKRICFLEPVFLPEKIRQEEFQMTKLYAILTSEIELHQKWVLKFQNSQTQFLDSIFEKFKTLIQSYFKFELKVD